MLVKNDDIAMQREDLTLSPSEVRVRYEMRNDSGKPVTLRVAFPMPEVPAWSPGGFHTTTNPRGIMLAKPGEVGGPNFIGFRVWADGRELTPEVEIRATLPDGRDIAASLQEIGGLALVMRSGLYALPDDPKLDDATRRRLAELGAIEELPDRAYRLPWTTRITFHWMQTFAPGVTVVEHSYRPILGFGYVGFGRQGALFAGPDEDAASVFCIDAAGRQTLRSLGERARAKRLAKGEPEFSELLGYTLGYVLQTAKNWRGPIGTFHLTVKGDPIPAAHWTDGGPTVAMSFCSPVSLTQTGPLLKEGEAQDFVPTSDLRILFVQE